jgi:hypothetical protein
LRRDAQSLECPPPKRWARTGHLTTAHCIRRESGTFSLTKRETGLLRMARAGVIVTDYATTMMEILKDNASPLANDLYAALDMTFAALVGRIFAANAKPAVLANR